MNPEVANSERELSGVSDKAINHTRGPKPQPQRGEPHRLILQLIYRRSPDDDAHLPTTTLSLVSSSLHTTSLFTMSADHGHLAQRMSIRYLTLPAAHDATPASPCRATHFPHPDLDGFNTSRATMASNGATRRTTTFIGFGSERPQVPIPQSWYAGNGLPQGYMYMSHERLRRKSQIHNHNV